MELHVARWGNSLAMRLPGEVVRQLGLREGDSVQAQFTADGTLAIRPLSWSRRAFAAELTQAREAVPETPAVIMELREQARY